MCDGDGDCKGKVCRVGRVEMTDRLTRYEFGRLVCEAYGLRSDDVVRPARARDLGLRPPRPRDLTLLNDRSHRVLGFAPKPAAEELAALAAELL